MAPDQRAGPGAGPAGDGVEQRRGRPAPGEVETVDEQTGRGRVHMGVDERGRDDETVVPAGPQGPLERRDPAVAGPQLGGPCGGGGIEDPRAVQYGVDTDQYGAFGISAHSTR